MLRTSNNPAPITPVRPTRTRVAATIAGLLVGVLAALSITTPAQAATASWTQHQGTSYPTIYQTNWLYYGNAFTAPTTPPGAVITTVYYRWIFMEIPPPLRIYTVYLCAGPNGTQCLAVSPNLSTQSWSATTTAFAGFPANTTFQYVVGIGAPTTYVLTPPKHSSSYELTVTYTY
ncbi:hypothetical protein [Polymorphospora rubra]|uniref:hypothetical protein n=1 Tax=Polymorphospora rubra TaxID=338584 RepID=UPI003403407F